METWTDEALMNAYQKGDYEAFEVLYRRYSPRLYGYLKSKLRKNEEVEEVFQTTFSKLHQFRSSYEKGAAFAPWFFTIGYNSLTDLFRKQGRTQERLTPEGNVPETPVEAAQDQPSQYSSHEISEWISHLDGSQAEALRLRYQEDKSFEQIAEALNVSLSNARQLVSRGSRKLRDLIKGGGVA